jgi:hypothetical protein
MIKKVPHNGMRAVAAGLVLVLLSPVSAYCQISASASGMPTQATPFDGKMDAAGGFSIETGAAQRSLTSSEELFMKARSMRYVSDPAGRDIWQTPQETESRWSGDCEDKAVWLYARLKQNGFSGVRLVVGRMHANGSGLHVWVTLSDSEGHTWILDPTAQRRIWKDSDFMPGLYRPIYSFDGMNRYRYDS